MKSYAVKETFYSIQGEGANAGRPAVFVRFSGCNLWSGREEDRGGSCSRWCDTDFVGGDRISAQEIAARVLSLWPREARRPFVVLTGGEPALQADGEAIGELKRIGAEVAIETNGTRPLPPGLDWVTVSPKEGAEVIVTSGDELKLAYPQDGMPPDRFAAWPFRHHYLQPVDGPDLAANSRVAAAYCMAHPKWRLSVQIQKSIGLR